jgi:hypothetical protein
MKKLCYGLICVLLSSAVSAQNNFFLGAKAGIGIPNLTSSSGNANPQANGWSSRLGPYFGLVSEYTFTKKWALQVELNFASQGGKKNGVQGIPSAEFASSFPTGMPVPDYLYANFKTVARLNYLEIPVMIKYSIPLNKKFDFFINAGPYMGFLLSAKNISTGSSNLYLDAQETQQVPTQILPQPISFDGTQDIKSSLKGFNTGIQGGVGVSLKVKNNLLFFAASGNYGFITIQKSSADGQNNTGAATATLGYLIKLK